MRPLFKVPGIGGFVWAMGMASGYPAGAKLTARLRQQQQLPPLKQNGSFRLQTRLIRSLFWCDFGRFFHNPNIGIVLALSHYLGNICVGLIMRFHGKDEEYVVQKQKRAFSVKRSARCMKRA